MTIAPGDRAVRSLPNGAARTPGAQLVLASGSPRRLALVQALGFRILQRPVDIDERAHAGEAPDAMVLRLAEAKARAGLALAGDAAQSGLSGSGSAEASLSGAGLPGSGLPGSGLPVLGADTVVVLDGAVLGKPVDRAEGMRMLRALSGRAHQVLTGVAVVAGSQLRVALSRSLVVFREIPAAEAERYWATGEPRDKAGGYGIQGVGGIFVERLEGSFSGVMGLPVAETEHLLRAAGVDCWRYRQGGSPESGSSEGAGQGSANDATPRSGMGPATDGSTQASDR